MGAARRWEQALAAWAWPDEIRAAAPADPWRLDPDDLAARPSSHHEHDSPADVAAREALPRRGSVLDVGCGTGASSAALRRSAGRITGVDPREEMLAVFAAATAEQPSLLRRIAGGVPEVRTVVGRWPAVAGQVELADVVLAHNVLYDVGDAVDAFVGALHHHAQERVVVALTARHPLHWVNPYAEALHGIRRPAEPTAELAADLVREVTGRSPTYLTWTEPITPPDDREAFLRMLARRICARPEQHDDLRALLHRIPFPEARDMAALVWPGGHTG